MEELHSAGYLHKDIKTESFRVCSDHKVKILDFSISKKYLDGSGNHITISSGKELKGTPLFASINNHNGLDMSRRDDLESLGYTFLHLLLDKLPWSSSQLNFELDSSRINKKALFN